MLRSEKATGSGPTFAGFQRPTFTAGQPLAPAHLNALGEYARDKLQTALRFLAGPGVAAGYLVQPTAPASAQVVVQPGYAVDGHGHDLYLRAPATLNLAGLLDPAGPCAGDGAQHYFLLIRYGEAPGESMPVCDSATWRQKGSVTVRITEGVRFELRRSTGQKSRLRTHLQLAATLGLLGHNYAGMQLLQVVHTGGRPVALALNPEGDRFYVAQSGAPALQVLDAQTGYQLQELELEQPARTLSFSPDGVLLAGTWERVMQLDPRSCQPVGDALEGLKYAVPARSLSQDHQMVADPRTGALRLLRRGKRIAALDLDTRVAGLAIHPEGIAFASLPLRNSIEVMRLDGGPGGTVMRMEAPGPGALELSPDGRYLYAALTNSNAVAVYDVRCLKQVAVWMAADRPHQLLHHPTEPLLFAVNRRSEEVTVLDATGGARLAMLKTGAVPGAAAFNLDAIRLWVPNHTGGSLSVFDISGRSLAQSLCQIASEAVTDTCGGAAAVPLARITVSPDQTVFTSESIDNCAVRAPLLSLARLTSLVSRQ